jgi:hypothetical protein
MGCLGQLSVSGEAVVSSDGSGYAIAIVLAIFLFHGDPDIADAMLDLLKSMVAIYGAFQ